MPKFVKPLIIGVSVLVGVIVLWPISCISANARGLRYTFGAAGDEILEPGINLRAPIIQRIKQWSIVPNDYDITVDLAENGAISKDNQILGVRTVVYWKYDENKLVVIAREWSDSRIEQMLKVNTIAAVKSVVGNYTIFDLAANQVKISDEILARVRIQSAVIPINVQAASVTNFDWSPEFDKQINATMAAAQRVREAEQQANISEQEQRKLAIEAEAKAKALIAQAEGEKKAAELRADAKRAEGLGIADYNKLISQNQQIEFRKLELEIEKIKAEKWDGHYVPNITPMLPNGAIINIPNSVQGK